MLLSRETITNFSHDDVNAGVPKDVVILLRKMKQKKIIKRNTMKKDDDGEARDEHKKILRKYSHWIRISSGWAEELMIALNAWNTFNYITTHIESKCH